MVPLLIDVVPHSVDEVLEAGFVPETSGERVAVVDLKLDVADALAAKLPPGIVQESRADPAAAPGRGWITRALTTPPAASIVFVGGE